MSKSTPSPATASQVRAFFTDEAKGQARQALAVKRAEKLGVKDPNSVLKCLGALARGRLHPVILAEFNAKRSQATRYVSGAERAAAAAKHNEAKSLRAKAMEQGIAVAAKGPLPKSVKALA